MWTVFLSLLACNPSRALDNGDETEDMYGGEITTRAKASAAGSLATRVDQRYDPAARPVGKVETPGGQLILNDCYGRSDDFGSNRSGLGSSGSGYGGGGMAAKGGGAPPRSAPKPSAARPMPSPMADGAAVTASAPPPPPAAAPMEVAAAEAPPPPVGERKKKEAPPAMSRGEGLADAKDADKARRSSDADEEYMGDRLLRQQQPKVEWDYGATVYLSNDDSMSLASAQRLLWAVDKGSSFSPREVRPHELLNYFSFDTVQPKAKQTFSVLGGAEQNGDTLSVALAVQGSMPERQPLDLSLVIDRSGSMRAEGRMDYVKRGLTKMTSSLKDGDRVDLTLFDSSVCSPVQNFVVGRDDMQVLQSAIDAMQPRGSTDLDGGLREGYRIQTARDAGDVHHRNRRILLLTDAFLNAGNVDESLVSEIGKRFETDGIRVTGIGVGREFNDKMLDLITEKGKGAYVYLGSDAVVDRVFGSGFDSLTQTIAHDVQFSIELPESLAMKKFYGEESSTNAEDVQPVNYYAGTSQVFLQDLKIRDAKPNTKDEVTFRIKFREAATGEPAEQVFTTTVGALLEGDTHNLDKAQALMAWTDLLAERALGDRNCSGLAKYRRAASQVQGDAEIAYVSSLTGKMCGVDMTETVMATGVAFKVKLDSDQAIAEVKLDCGGESWAQSISSGSNVARFEQVYPGSCRLQLDGVVPMTASVEVPAAGGDVRCLVRGGRVNCD